MRAFAVTPQTLATHVDDFDGEAKYLQLLDLPLPSLQGGDVLVRPLLCAIGGNTKAWSSGNYMLSLDVLSSMSPFIPGTSCVGVVDRFASNCYGLLEGQVVWTASFVQSVKNDDRVPDDGLLVGLLPTSPHSEVLLQHYKNGCWAERVRLPVANVYPIPQSLASNSSALLQIAYYLGTYAIAMGAIEASGLNFGDTLLVNGAYGNLGSSTVHLAILMGCRKVWCVGRNAEKLATMKSTILTACDLDPESEILSLFSYDDLLLDDSSRVPPTIGIDFLGNTPDPEPTITCLKTLAPRGTYVLAGGVQADIPLPYNLVLVRQLRLVGSLMYRREVPTLLLQMIGSGRLSLPGGEGEEVEFEDEEGLNRALVEMADDRQKLMYLKVSEI